MGPSQTINCQVEYSETASSIEHTDSEWKKHIDYINYAFIEVMTLNSVHRATGEEQNIYLCSGEWPNHVSRGLVEELHSLARRKIEKKGTGIIQFIPYQPYLNTLIKIHKDKLESQNFSVVLQKEHVIVYTEKHKKYYKKPF